MGVNSFTGFFGLMSHHQINAHLVCTGRIKPGTECVSAFMRCMPHIQRLHQTFPYNAICTNTKLLSIIGYKILIIHIIVFLNNRHFCHCKSLLVKIGQIVKTGDALAVMGNTGNAALNDPPYCHCHFETRATATGRGLDPTAYAGIPNRIGIYGEKPSSTTQTPTKAPVAGTKEDWTTAKSKDDSAKYGVRYRVYPYALHLRKGAGTDQPIVKTLRAGTTLAYYGLYTVRDGVKWMYVMLSDKTTGFVSEQYIKKG